MLARKLSCLLVPAVLGMSAALPSRAQTGTGARYAFADTTLLRDTLGLRFDRLFPLADSLRMSPDSLRALSVRLGFAPARMVELADSLHVPVDSVGTFLEREKFNPLAQRAQRANTFSYTTSYSVQQTRSTWSNNSDYGLSWQDLFVRNTAAIQMDRFRSGNRTTVRETRTSTTEAGWKLGPDYSVGGRAVLNRFDTDDPSANTSVGETRGEYQFSVRTRQRPTPGMSSELNLFSGLIDLQNSGQDKRGLTGEMNGRFRHTSGSWFVHEITGQATGNLTRTLLHKTGELQNTRDILGNMSGTLNLFEQSPVGFNSTYGYQGSRVSALDGAGVLRPVRTTGADANGTVRAALGARGAINVTESVSLSDQVTASGGPSTRRGNSFHADGRYERFGTTLETGFQLGSTRSEVPEVTASKNGGYGEGVADRALNGSLTRRLFGRITARADTRIGLTRYRYRAIGDYGTPPASRDQVQQSYRVDASYAGSADFSTGVSLDVARNQTVNLPSASTSVNNTQRVYRAEWRWTYRLMRGLTATQRNSLGATYIAYNFVPSNDRALLEYGTVTTLNTILTPRLTLDLTHTRRVQPGGNYTRYADGLYYLSPADRSTLYSLTTRISYTPAQALSFQLEPFFQSSGREGSSAGVLVPQRDDRTFTFFGNANLNLRVGRRGQLTGNIGRSLFASRSAGFIAGVPQPSLVSESRFWNGTLNFAWRI